MNKTEFLSRLRINLCGVGEQDIKTAEDFYCEMIDDRVESGMSCVAVCMRRQMPLSVRNVRK